MKIITPASRAAELTARLWALSDPTPTRGTTGLFPVETARDKSAWLRVTTDFSIPVRKDATLGKTIPKILQPWIDDGSLPSSTLTQLSGYIASMRGKRLVVYEAFPQFFKEQAKTHQQMIDAGLLAAPRGTA